MSNEQVIWRGSSNTRLPPLNHVLVERLGLEALHHSTITALTTLGTREENDSLATGLEGRVMVNRRLMKWIVRWDWSPALGISPSPGSPLEAFEHNTDQQESISTTGMKYLSSVLAKLLHFAWTVGLLEVVLPSSHQIISTRS